MLRKIASRSQLAWVLTAVACATSGDGTDSPPDVDPPVDSYELPTPELVALAPTQVAVGDRVQVFGKNLVGPEHGTMALHLVGNYLSEDAWHEGEPFDAEVPLTYVNPGVAELEFGPRVIFSSAGDVIGTFSGTATLVNRAGTDEKLAVEQQVSIQVLPSLLVEELHSVDDASCAPVTAGTVGTTNLGLAVRAIGLGEATPDRPIWFNLLFRSPSIEVQYIRREWYYQWPVAPTYFAAAPAGDNVMQLAITEGDTLYLDPKLRQHDVTISPSVEIGQQQYTGVTLYKIGTGKLEGPGPAYANFGIEGVAGDGRRATRVASIAVWNEAEIEQYDGNQHLSERYPAAQVSGCFYGGDIGRDLTYTEGQSESRTRSVSYRWDINNATSVGLQVGTSFHLGNGLNPVISYGADVHATASFNQTWSQTFGVDVSESVSTEHHTGQNFSAHILPTFYGTCYRQTERVDKSVNMVYHNKCGVSADIGKAILTDWNWGFDIGSGPDCPPPTHLPPAEKFE